MHGTSGFDSTYRLYENQFNKAMSRRLKIDANFVSEFAKLRSACVQVVKTPLDAQHEAMYNVNHQNICQGKSCCSSQAVAES